MRTLHRGQPCGLLQGSKVDRLEDLAVQLLRLRAVEGQAQQDECVRKALRRAWGMSLGCSMQACF